MILKTSPAAVIVIAIVAMTTDISMYCEFLTVATAASFCDSNVSICTWMCEAVPIDPWCPFRTVRLSFHRVI
jgi:hypothetical protein